MYVYNLRTQITVSYGLEHELLQADSSICKRGAGTRFFAAIREHLCSRPVAIGIHTRIIKPTFSTNLQQLRRDYLCVERHAACTRQDSNAMLMHMNVYNLRTQITVSYGLEHELLQADSALIKRESKYEVLCGNTWTSLFSCSGHRLTHTHFKTPLFNKPSAATTRLSLCREACSMYATRLFCYTEALNPRHHPQKHALYYAAYCYMDNS